MTSQLVLLGLRELSSKFVDLSLMHYFIGIEVLKIKEETFLWQGNCTNDFLQRFGIINWKSMSTPIVSSLKKLHELDFGSDPVDATKYR